MKKWDDFEDDGRTVADMSGIETPGLFSLKGKAKKMSESDSGKSDFSQDERRIYLKAAMLSTLLIASVFLIAAALFILFCQHIWLK